jgi:hypothetical protein
MLLLRISGGSGMFQYLWVWVGLWVRQGIEGCVAGEVDGGGAHFASELLLLEGVCGLFLRRDLMLVDEFGQVLLHDL